MKWLLLNCIVLVYSLTLYVVPHSHCDAGWLRTFDQYYQEKVSNILTSTLKIMKENQEYKFVWSETSFLQRWMEDQSKAKQDEMRSLIQSGRIEIVGGGFSQHDEALSDFESVIRNLETGHRYLKDNFGIDQIEVAWQIDPFGHSALSPAIFSKFGYKYMVGSRIDNRLKDELVKNKTMEFVWEGSKLGGNPSLLTHILKNGYNPPDCPGLIKDSCCFNQLDPVNAWYFYNYAQQMAEIYRTGNVKMLLGDDFTFENYNHMVIVFDALYRSSQLVISDPAFSGFKIKIATATEYFRAIENSGTPFSIYKGDFLPHQQPNSINSPAYWTGFYTTRPDLKKKISEVHKLARATEIALALGLKEEVRSPGASMAIHHDAITGTCKDHVKQDYIGRLEIEEQSYFGKLERVFNALLGKKETKLSFPYKVFIIFNSLNWEKEDVITIKSVTKYMTVLDWNLENVESQSVPTDKEYEIYIKVKIPSLSVVTIFARNSNQPCFECSEVSETSNSKVASDSYHTIHFNEKFLIDKIETKSGRTWNMNQQFWNYPGTKGGFYIYAPETEGTSMLHLFPSTFKVHTGSIVTVVKSAWIKMKNKYKEDDQYEQTVILSNSKKFTIKVGVFAHKSEEILMRFTEPALEELEWFYTSNSADLRLRKYQEQDVQKQGHNMYPVPGGFCVRGKESVLNVFPSFNLGVGIKSSTSFEMLLHRNLPKDDGWGIEEGYSDSSFIEHSFDMEISDFNPHEFFKSYFDSKNALIVKPAKMQNELISIVKGGSHNLYDEWPLKTQYSFEIEDEKAYLSSAVIRDDKLLMRIFNFDSDLMWKNVTFGSPLLFNGYKNYSDNIFFAGIEQNPGKSKLSNISESNIVLDNYSQYILFKSRPYSGYPPEDWEGFEFSSYMVSYDAPVVVDEIPQQPEDEPVFDQMDNQEEASSPELKEISQEENIYDKMDSDTQYQDNYQASIADWTQEYDEIGSKPDWDREYEEIDSKSSLDKGFEERNENFELDTRKEATSELAAKTNSEFNDLPAIENYTSGDIEYNEPTSEDLQEDRKFLEDFSYQTLSKQTQTEQNIKALEYSVILVLSLIFLGSIFYYFRAKKRSID